MAQRVLIGGGSGFVGQTLTKHFTQKGYSVTHISRTSGQNRVLWKDIEQHGIPEVDAVVQISGANVLARPWTEARKKELLDSRVHTTATLVNAIQKSTAPPKVFISGSAIGIYPTSPTEEFDEDSTKLATDFAGNMVKSWEQASLPLENSKTRRVVTRFGVVLGDGGMMGGMFIPFQFGLGGPIGSGNQYMPWIHVEDIARLHSYIIEHPEIKGVLNAVAPQMVTNREFVTTLGKAMHRPSFFPLPSFLVKLLFGQRAFLLLEGQKVLPKHTLASGFNFQFPDLESALRDVVRTHKGQ